MHRWTICLMLAAASLSADERKLQYVETHTHINPQLGRSGRLDIEGAVRQAVASMDRLGCRKALLVSLHPPSIQTFEQAQRNDLALQRRLVAAAPQRFGLLAGGTTLNFLIRQAVRAGSTSAELKRQFIAEADRIGRSEALGFGEMFALHFSFNRIHPFIQVPADHPLFLALAEAAARHDKPIDLHMEAVTRDRFPFPHDAFTRRSSSNPALLDASVAPLERLLRHQRKARVIWVHAGWDHTGQMTTTLLRRLLRDHPNLYLSLKHHEHSLEPNRTMDRQAKLRADWLALLTDYPERFVLGADQIYLAPGAPRRFPDSAAGSRRIVDQLPPALAAKVAYANAAKLYRLTLDPK